MTNTTDIIRTHNDQFRQGHGSIQGMITITSGIAALLEQHGSDPLTIIRTVQTFDTFTEENDPHGEHDFGAFEAFGQKCFWKIDLYNQTLDAFTPDPTDPQRTHRVLTIMLASEY
ncbi:DUF3768 domain-containing protein [Pontivivens insulae]|uniref:DUF3768 domain-containing protein n=1 Tax=Pontivivens insulae TaxID=1639689 RepID=A0A2R8ACJ7_9RHOB|nr:DUF3768 domain-containing protein [Pontivivens insulae]RED13902.1 uncharacterized protein DUF3768 [Pontivivens insulae]SPF29976.1 hypothetical protein POI8812_02303 [Pontivivens insulae]